MKTDGGTWATDKCSEVFSLKMADENQWQGPKTNAQNVMKKDKGTIKQKWHGYHQGEKSLTASKNFVEWSIMSNTSEIKENETKIKLKNWHLESLVQCKWQNLNCDGFKGMNGKSRAGKYIFLFKQILTAKKGDRTVTDTHIYKM